MDIAIVLPMKVTVARGRLSAQPGGQLLPPLLAHTLQLR